MTYEIHRNECSRCSRIAYCIHHYALGVLCEGCFITVHNDPSEKQTIDRVYQDFGIEQIEKIKQHEWDLDKNG